MLSEKHVQSNTDGLVEPLTSITKMLAVLLLIVVIARSAPEFKEVELVMVAFMVALIAVWSVIGVLMAIPEQREIYISAAILAALRNFAVVFLLLDMLTDDPAAFMYVIVPSSIAMLACAVLPYLTQRACPQALD